MESDDFCLIPILVTSFRSIFVVLNSRKSHLKEGWWEYEWGSYDCDLDDNITYEGMFTSTKDIMFFTSRLFGGLCKNDAADFSRTYWNGAAGAREEAITFQGRSI